MNSPTEHTVKAFDSDLSELRGLIAEIGGRSERAIANAMIALERRDLKLAEQVIDEDRLIDALERKIDEQTIRTIALRSPMADDLRELIAVMKISGLVERIGDYAKNIARRVPSISADSKLSPVSLLPSMSSLASELVHDALEAFARRDADLAERICKRDQVLDDFYATIFRSTITYMIENPSEIGEGAHILFIAKNLERIGDHATNVAEMVYFSVVGHPMAERERGEDPVDLDVGEPIS